ncbi:hypothetical protein CC80DRAFT_409903, partial [Byssothecium circinans]
MPLRYICPGLTEPTLSLSNAIDPIFDQTQWEFGFFTTYNTLWTGITPALQMATRLLQSEPVMRSLRKLKYGQRRRDGKTKKTYLDWNSADDDTTRAIENTGVRNDLIALATKLRFVFGSFLDHGGASLHHVPSQIQAMHLVGLNELGKRYDLSKHGNTTTLRHDGSRHYIVINDAYRQFYSMPPANRTPFQNLRTAWVFASSLVHELIHAFNAREITDGKENFHEPY